MGSEGAHAPKRAAHLHVAGWRARAAHGREVPLCLRRRGVLRVSGRESEPHHVTWMMTGSAGEANAPAESDGATEVRYGGGVSRCKLFGVCGAGCSGWVQLAWCS